MSTQDNSATPAAENVTQEGQSHAGNVEPSTSEADNAQSGDQVAQETESLLAGKFQSKEDLIKSLSELETDELVQKYKSAEKQFTKARQEQAQRTRKQSIEVNQSQSADVNTDELREKAPDVLEDIIADFQKRKQQEQKLEARKIDEADFDKASRIDTRIAPFREALLNLGDVYLGRTYTDLFDEFIAPALGSVSGNEEFQEMKQAASSVKGSTASVKEGPKALTRDMIAQIDPDDWKKNKDKYLKMMQE